MKKKMVGMVLTMCLVASMIMGCGEKKEAAKPAEETKEETVAKEEPKKEEVKQEETKEAAKPAGNVKFNYTPEKNTTGKEFRIATLCVQNNPFWVDVKAGIDAATKELAGADYKTTVDFISMDDFDGQLFAEAIDTCIVKEYDAICTVGVADAIVPSINKAVAAGIPVYIFNSDTAKKSDKTAFVGQDLYAAGGVAADTLAGLIGKKGEVGVITGLYSVNAHELRRTGFEDKMKADYPDVKIVGSTENHDSADEAYSQTKDFITANPNLSGIVVTAGGPHGAAKAIEELGMQDKISLVSFDTTTEIVGYLEKGIIKGTVTQDPFGQGADPLILAYNELVTGKAAVIGDAFTKMNVVTPENVKEYFPK